MRQTGMAQPYEKIVRLKLKASDGKQRETDCANTKSLFRIIQSIPSPKAELFKQWLAKVDYERVKELAADQKDLPKARRLVSRKVRKAIEDLGGGGAMPEGLPTLEKKAKSSGRRQMKIEDDE